MDVRPHLLVMVGLPARGKTYIAMKLARSVVVVVVVVVVQSI